MGLNFPKICYPVPLHRKLRLINEHKFVKTDSYCIIYEDGSTPTDRYKYGSIFWYLYLFKDFKKVKYICINIYVMSRTNETFIFMNYILYLWSYIYFYTGHSK